MGGKLWVALQANVLSDVSYTIDGLEEKFKEMISNLTTLFTIPNLTRNMRNSQNINKVSQGVEETYATYKIANMIEKLPPPTTSSSNEESILIPVHYSDFESNFPNILSEAVFDSKKKTLILHSENFKGKNLKSLFLKAFPEIEPKTILQHDNHPNDATKKDLQYFLKNPEIKIGIFQSRFVTGMESSNVIYFHDPYDFDTSVRCTMTRAVSHLFIIVRFNDSNTTTTFKSMKVNNKFIKCKRIFDNDDEYYECLSCNTNQICFACLIACHQEHKTKYETYVNEENMKCNCNKSNCFIQKD